MKNLSLQKITLWIGVLALWVFLFLISSGAFAQSWVNVGNGLQQKVVGSDTLYRFVKTSGSGGPFKISDSLKAKLFIKDSVSKYVTPTQLSRKSSNITRSNISLATDENTRKDASSVVRLSNDSLAIAYSNFDADASDFGESSIYVKTSGDEGVTWNNERELIPKLSIGSYLPSFYKKTNGNILCVFYVRETNAPYTSSLRKIEFSGDLQTVITPSSTIISGGYYAVGSDRLHFDEINGLLVMPYPYLVSGNVETYDFVASGKMLISDDEGDTWTDSGLDLSGVLNVNGYGGVIEPGVFDKEGQLVYYFRTFNGNIYAYDLSFISGNYVAPAGVYNIGIKSTNAMSSIKYIPILGVYAAAYTKLMENPDQRKIIDLSLSSDGLNWFPAIQVENGVNRLVNEPNIYFDDILKKIIVSYSLEPTSGKYDLLGMNIPYSSLIGTGGSQTQKVIATNPTGTERNEIAISDLSFSNMSEARVGNVIRSYVNVGAEIEDDPGVFSGTVLWQNIKSIGAKKDFKLPSLTNVSIQNILENVSLDGYVQLSIDGFAGGNLPTTTDINKLTSLRIHPIFRDDSPKGTVNEKIAIDQQGVDDKNIFNGKIYGAAADFIGDLKIGEQKKLGFRYSPTNDNIYQYLTVNNDLVADLQLWNNTTSDPTSKMFSFNSQLGELAAIYNNGAFVSSKYKLSALNTAPSSSTDTGTTGEIRITDTFIYVCIATNTWVRAALTTW